MDTRLFETNNKVYFERYGMAIPAPEGVYDIYTELSRDADRTLYIKQNDTIYRMNSLYSPSHEAEHWSMAYRFDDLKQEICVFGFGAGHFIRALLSCGDDTTLYVYEPSNEIFWFVCNNYDVKDLLSNKRVRLVLNTGNWQEMTQVIAKEMNGSGYSRMKLVPIPGYDKLFPNVMEEYREIVRRGMEAKFINATTIINRYSSLVDNNLYMMSRLTKIGHITEVKERLEGKDVPFILVSTGPSLEKNIDELKQAKNRAIIVSYNFSTEVLIDHGIMPDVLVHVDSVPGAPIDPRSVTLPMICPGGAEIRIQDMFGERLIMSGFDLPCHYIRGLQHFVSVRGEGGSVALAAFNAAIYLGARHIILVGQDLALGDAGRTHAGKRSVDVIGNEGAFEVEGYYGGMVWTRPDFNIFRNGFEMTIKACGDELKVINATEGGAMIHGAQNMPLRDAIQKYCTQEYDIEGFFANLKRVQTPEQREETRKDLSRYLIEWEEYRNNFQEMAKILGELKKLLLKGEHATDAAQELNNRYKALDNHWKESSSADMIQHMVMRSSQKYDEAASHTGGEDAVETVYDAAIAIYTEASEELGKWMQVIRERFDLKEESLLIKSQ